MHVVAVAVSLLFIQVAFAQSDQNFKVKGKTNCNDLPADFKDAKEAVLTIRQTTFAYSQEMNTTRVSGSKKAHFRSCDLSKGYLLVEIDSTWNVHPNVPLLLWEEYSASRDLQGFYEDRIRGEYPAIKN